MRDNPKGSDLDNTFFCQIFFSEADDVRRKNYSSVLSCIDKKTKEGCDRDSEVGTVHSERDGKGQFEKDFVSRWYSGMPCLCWAKGSVAPDLASESASSLQESPE